MRNRVRRFRRTRADRDFSSAQARREADLFWASLVGGRPMPPRPPQVPGLSATSLALPPPAALPDLRAPESESEAYEQAPEAEWYEYESDGELPTEALPAGLTASPCDVSKTSETLDQFAKDSSTLTTAHRTAIGLIADCMLALRASPRPIRTVNVTGFTDPSGTATNNQSLGQRRAEAVRTGLIAALNSRAAGSAAGFTITPRSGGATQQIPGGDAANRRAEVFVDVAVTDVVVHTSDANTHEIPSNLGAAGLEHFCCVKDTGDIALEALITPAIPGAIGGRLTWGAFGTAITTPGIGTDGRTATLSSAAHGKFAIVLNWDGAVARRAVVWVIWSRFAVTCRRTVTTVTFPGQFGISCGIDHAYEVLPQQIITDADRPALDGPPTAPVPGAALQHAASAALLGGGANKKWDVTRRVRVKALNPRLYKANELPPVAATAHMWTGQPVADATPESFPADQAQGNDDTSTCDETNNPYENCGFLTSTDNPTIPMRNATGADGDTFEMRIHFGEFLRVNLGTTWYRASDFSPWRFHPRFRRAAGAWTNDASQFATDNAGF